MEFFDFGRPLWRHLWEMSKYYRPGLQGSMSPTRRIFQNFHSSQHKGTSPKKISKKKGQHIRDFFSTLGDRCADPFNIYPNIIGQDYRARCPLQDVYFGILALCRIRALLPREFRQFLTLRLWPRITLKPFGLERWNLVGLWGPMAPTVEFSERFEALIHFEKSGIYCTIGFMQRAICIMHGVTSSW